MIRRFTAPQPATRRDAVPFRVHAIFGPHRYGVFAHTDTRDEAIEAAADLLAAGAERVNVHCLLPSGAYSTQSDRCRRIVARAETRARGGRTGG